MQALAYARETHDRIESIGISKPPCQPCEQQLDRQNVSHHHDEDGLKKPRNWEGPDKIEVEKFAKVSKPKVKFEGDLMHHQNNIPKTGKDLGKGVKQNVKDQQQIHPKNLKKVNLNAAAVLDMIDQIDKVIAVVLFECVNVCVIFI